MKPRGRLDKTRGRRVSPTNHKSEFSEGTLGIPAGLSRHIPSSIGNPWDVSAVVTSTMVSIYDIASDFLNFLALNVFILIEDKLFTFLSYFEFLEM